MTLNVHLHPLVLDGVFRSGLPDGLTFHPAPPPGDAEVAQVLATIRRRVQRLLVRRNLDPGAADTEPPDPLAEVSLLLAGLADASVQGRVALGPRAGRGPHRRRPARRRGPTPPALVGVGRTDAPGGRARRVGLPALWRPVAPHRRRARPRCRARAPRPPRAGAGPRQRRTGPAPARPHRGHLCHPRPGGQAGLSEVSPLNGDGRQGGRLPRSRGPCAAPVAGAGFPGSAREPDQSRAVSGPRPRRPRGSRGGLDARCTGRVAGSGVNVSSAP
ncbi:MAG: hypothetical protein HYU42_05540 [Candidatus Rokubacteria bacterium]|nr:hypothetical protein [Candidatus Rokubacteria bacterium]